MASGYILVAALFLVTIHNVKSFEFDSIDPVNDQKHANRQLQGRELFEKFIRTYNRTYNNEWRK